MNSNKLILIPLKEYEELLKDSALLEALRQGGVDNWDWYDDSISDYYQEPIVDEKLIIKNKDE